MKKQNFNIFLDMDDTLANFSDGITSQKKINKLIHTKGYFKGLQPLPFLEEMNKIAAIFPQNIFILSACSNTPYCKEEKILWLKKYLPFASKENVIFTNVGDNKAEMVKPFLGKEIDKYCILIDDYSKNVYEWEAAGGTAIKFKNSFNTNHPENYKYIISNFTELMGVIEDVRTELEEK